MAHEEIATFLKSVLGFLTPTRRDLATIYMGESFEALP